MDEKQRAELQPGEWLVPMIVRVPLAVVAIGSGLGIVLISVLQLLGYR